MEQELLTPQELADKLKVTRASITNWRKDGMPIEIEKPPRFYLIDVQAWLKARTSDKKTLS